jgi:hypothetical protein
MPSIDVKDSTPPDSPHVKRVCLQCNCTRRKQVTHCPKCGLELIYKCKASGKKGLLRNLHRHLQHCEYCSSGVTLQKQHRRETRIQEVVLRDQQLDSGQSLATVTQYIQCYANTEQLTLSLSYIVSVICMSRARTLVKMVS